jgi:hypothetical protein
MNRASIASRFLDGGALFPRAYGSSLLPVGAQGREYAWGGVVVPEVEPCRPLGLGSREVGLDEGLEDGRDEVLESPPPKLNIAPFFCSSCEETVDGRVEASPEGPLDNGDFVVVLELSVASSREVIGCEGNMDDAPMIEGRGLCAGVASLEGA